MSPLSLDPFMALVQAATCECVQESAKSRNAPVTPTATPPPVVTSHAVSCASVSPIPSERIHDSFAETLMKLLHDDEYSNIVTFLPDGQSFGIINAKEFAYEVMPKVLGIRAFSSFVRKLRRWGFERIMEKKTHDVDVFRHSHFRKGDWAMCRRIRCGDRQQQQEIQALPVFRPLSRTTPQQKIRPPSIPKATSHPTSHSSPWQTQAIHEVTSHIVGAALDALRRDGEVPARPSFYQIVANQRKQACLMALAQHHIPHYTHRSFGL